MKIFIDAGCFNGDTILGFLSEDMAYNWEYKQRDDAKDYRIIGFDGHNWEKEWKKVLEKYPDVDIDFREAILFNQVTTVGYTHSNSWRGHRLDGIHGEHSPLVKTKGGNLAESESVDFGAFLSDSFSEEDYIVLKMDIQGSEFPILDQLFETGLIHWINEIYIELHSSKRYDREMYRAMLEEEFSAEDRVLSIG